MRFEDFKMQLIKEGKIERDPTAQEIIDNLEDSK